MPLLSPLADKSNPFVVSVPQLCSTTSSRPADLTDTQQQTPNANNIGNNNALGEQEDGEPQFSNVNRRLFRASDLMDNSSPPKVVPKDSTASFRHGTPGMHTAPTPGGSVDQAQNTGTKRSLSFSQTDLENNRHGENSKRVKPNHNGENMGTGNNEICEGMKNNNTAIQGASTSGMAADLQHAFSPLGYIGLLPPFVEAPQVVQDNLYLSSMAFFSTLPLYVEEDATAARLFCPVNHTGEPDPNWKEFPSNPHYPVCLPYL